MEIRSVKGSDYYAISPLINEWWGGRQMSDMLPKLFFDHFTNTSFIAEKEGNIVGFLIGILSQSQPDEAYIHFVGVHPEYRENDIGRQLYNQFFRCRSSKWPQCCPLCNVLGQQIFNRLSY